jgi:hypothetical protein
MAVKKEKRGKFKRDQMSSLTMRNGYLIYDLVIGTRPTVGHM